MTKSSPSPEASAAQRKNKILSSSATQRNRSQAASESSETALSRKRKDLKGIAIYMNQPAKRTLDKIAYEQEKSVQELGLEALNLLFVQYGEKPIA